MLKLISCFKGGLNEPGILYLGKKDYRDIYCDESFPGHSPAFGALICTPIRSGKLKERIRKVREQYGYSRELKWSKIDSNNFDIAKAFVYTFLEDAPRGRGKPDSSKIYIMRVVKGRNWNNWEKTNESKYFKSLYSFLRIITKSYHRYDIYVDSRSSKPYRWTKVQYLNNMKRKQDYQLKHINFGIILPIDSKENDSVQLVDLILGASLLSTDNEVKAAFQKMIIQHPNYHRKVHLLEPFVP